MQMKVQPFLMFEGRAEEAMNFYVSIFPEGWITDISRYGPGEQGKEGTVKVARFTLAGQSVMCIDSPVKHAFTFTPAFSFFVDVTSEAELRRLASVLGEGGGVMMPLANYGFSKLFTWLNDRYGVSWQLNWP
ncbi:MAG: VOC family protein [Pseudolabrys sp.]|nr:VOC family protein [Pseudolabrys sp.]